MTGTETGIPLSPHELAMTPEAIDFCAGLVDERLMAGSIADADLDNQAALYALLRGRTSAQETRRWALADELTARRHARRGMKS